MTEPAPPVVLRWGAFRDGVLFHAHRTDDLRPICGPKYELDGVVNWSPCPAEPKCRACLRALEKAERHG